MFAYDRYGLLNVFNTIIQCSSVVCCVITNRTLYNYICCICRYI